jgi:hypothetical protein
LGDFSNSNCHYHPGQIAIVCLRNPSNEQPGFYVFLNTGNGFDSGKQWQSNLGGDENWKNRTSYRNGERSMLACIKIDKQPCLVSLWVSVKDSIR